MTTSLPQNERDPINATYFREYGLHDTGLGEPTFIASAREWGDMEQILKSQMPYNGEVVTNDYATLSDDITNIPAQMDEINQRIRAVKWLTMRTDATVHLGTPAVGPTGDLHTAALSIRRGEIVGQTFKHSLYPVEVKMGMSAPDKPPNKTNLVRKNGAAVLICSDLIRVPGHMSAYDKQMATRVLGLTAWAYSDVGNATDKDYVKRNEMLAMWIEDAGGEDNYHRNNLERTVTGFILHNMPNVRSVVIADEGREDLTPYNAVYRRAA
jgi:hypothetical protein